MHSINFYDYWIRGVQGQVGLGQHLSGLCRLFITFRSNIQALVWSTGWMGQAQAFPICKIYDCFALNLSGQVGRVGLYLC